MIFFMNISCISNLIVFAPYNKKKEIKILVFPNFVFGFSKYFKSSVVC